MFDTIQLLSLILQLAMLAGFGLFVYPLLRQQGRILLELEGLKGRLQDPREAGGRTADAGSGPRGLDVGTSLADLSLLDTNGEQVPLETLRGSRLLFVYWSDQCGYCEDLANALSPVATRMQENNLRIVLAAWGKAKDNLDLVAEHRLSCTLLMIEGSPAQSRLENEVFEYCGTPSAYLLDEHLATATPLASGAQSIVEMARTAIEKPVPTNGSRLRKLPLSKSRIERDGLKAGATAPYFVLPNLHGGTVTLDEFRGRKLLLVFSDPQCGPCDELAPRLVELHRRHRDNGMAVVMIGRGDAEQNRKKAVEHGISFPVLLQERWKLSRQYGIFATPVAFLIGQDGTILKNVALGPDQIMNLASEGLAAACTASRNV